LNNAVLSHVTLKVAFDLISVDDGSCHTVESFGEALDDSDKATAKAMSAAYKSAMLQSFCVPVLGMDAPDRGKIVVKRNHGPEPLQGWDQWSNDIIEMIRVCQSEAALTRVQTTNRAMLQAIQRERCELYVSIGDEFAARRRSFCSSPSDGGGKNSASSMSAVVHPRSRKSAKAKTPEHA
jgi:hypothetical protein